MKFKSLKLFKYNMTTTSKNLTFPEFDDIKVSTKTFIAMTNLSMNLKRLFEFLPITEYVVIPKKRGRKKKVSSSDPNVNVKSGSIITMKYENKLKGVDLKQKKNQTKKKTSKWFRNSFTVVMLLDGKTINFKICQNGMFQITGCKLDSHAEDCIKYIWEYIKDESDIYTFNRGENIETLFIPAMRNIDFDIGFNVDREKLANYMSTQTEFHSLLETSFGYTGVNIKIPIQNDVTQMVIKKLAYINNSWIENMTIYDEYLQFLTKKERLKKVNKERYNTFLVFHSGKTIFSGSCADFMRDSYYYFLKIIKKAYPYIEERLDKI
jgi:TATA-box binding protein (TBP) (component of TFIID and TFIIIB)